MRSDLLHVFTARFNPIRWQKPQDNYVAWAKHMLDCGVKLHVAEVTYGDQPPDCEIPGVDHIRLCADSWAWSKECAINLAIQRVPEAQYIACVDSDVHFRDTNWAVNTVRALNHYRVVQPWVTALDLGPNGELMQTHRSFCSAYAEGKPVVAEGQRYWKYDGGYYEYPHPGFAWAYTREMLDHVGGLFEVGGMGSGDHHMALALVGRVDRSYPDGTHPNYKTMLNLWQSRAQRFVRGRIGVVHGVIEHQFHGSKKSRGYIDRWGMFIKHQFDPVVDLKRNTHGVLEFSGNKPELEREWDQYLRSRQEDGNLG